MTMRHPRLRLTLATILAAALTAGNLTACGTAEPTRTVSVLTSWTDDDQNTEATAFHEVIKFFEKKTGINVEPRGTRDVGQALQSSIERHNPPDIALLPRLGDVHRYSRQQKLLPLDSVAFQPGSTRQLIKVDQQIFAVSVLTHPKSLIWYRSGPPPFRAKPPATWSGLEAFVGGHGRSWCLGMASSPLSGWPGTDAIEDILLHQAGEKSYSDWATGTLPWNDPNQPIVRSAWETWKSMLPATPDKRQTALLTRHNEAWQGMLDEETCHLDHQASFILGAFGTQSAKFDFIEFPAIAPGDMTAREVSDDVAGMFRDTAEARELLIYLASAEAHRIWRDHSAEAVFTLNTDIGPGDYTKPVSQRIAQLLKDGVACRDASDQMPAAMTVAFQNALLEYVIHPDRLDRLLTDLERMRLTLLDEWMNTLPCQPLPRSTPAG